ncbi:hypothetical protein V5O48_002870 [Marasmius crinis-equi]|uniref:Uncharacterized protein n=1 Tax=Marasmius crinis-equi TaxID=585013 RepID=A0ABR3FUY1_9AGAR
MIPMSLLLMAPYVVQIAFTIAGVIAVMTSNNEVQRSFFYCTLAEHPLSNATSIFVFIICLGIILLKIQLALTFYRNWVALRTARRRFQTPAVHAQIPVLRVLVFGAYVFVGMVCNVIKLFDPHNLGPYLYVAIAGLVVFLVFGTQSHILQAWAFWKWRWRWPSRPAQPPPPLVATPNPLLTVDGYVSSPPANWRDTSILSPVRRIENSNPITTRTTEMQETDIDVPPTPPPKAQIVRRFYTDRELDDNGVRMTRQTTEGRLVASYVDYHQTRSDIV